MKLFLDTADFDEIKQGVDRGVIDGVIMNPTLIAKAGRDHEIRSRRSGGSSRRSGGSSGTSQPRS